ncbi:MAG TPA: cytochrome c oxidase subunit II [Phycisphaerales bacterium]|jgi:cytochrome c oxidase subunit 2|nr:cytochrome c oxidase subunit II [Phycisphaerales bacterium]
MSVRPCRTWAFSAAWLSPASTDAVRVDVLFWCLVAFCLAVILLVAWLVLYACIKYRAGSPADRTGRLRTTPVELTWLGLTFVAFLAMGSWAAVDFYHQQTPPLDADPVYVVGKQWMWKIEHPSGRREINELHVPLGVPTRLVIASEDVIHSFFLPAFRIKQDAVPGRYTSLWVEPTREGVFPLYCAEYCGAGHSTMIGHIIVMRPEDLARWLSDRSMVSKAPGMPGTSEAPLRIGRQLFYRLGCADCHVQTGRVLAPRLDGLWGRYTVLSSGRVVPFDENYIRESVLDPQAKIAAGYASPSIMPSFRGQVSEDDLRALVEFIRSIRHGWPEGDLPGPDPRGSEGEKP